MGIKDLYEKAFRLKFIHYLNGRRQRRPGKNHPNPEHWEDLRKQRWESQNGECGTCSASDALELHHRHYDRWGAELLADVILLCRPCHEAITSRIRDARYAAGELEPPPPTGPQGGVVHPRFMAKETVLDVKADEADTPCGKITPRFRAESFY